MPHHRTTTDMLRAVRAGPDDPAWQDFVDRYQPLLTALGRRIGLSPEDALDISQQTLLEFVRDLRAGHFDRQAGRMRTWVLAIARNRVRDLQRRRAVEHRALDGGRRPSCRAMSAAGADGSGASAEREGARAGPAGPTATEPPSDGLERLWEEERQKRVVAEALSRLRQETALAERTLEAFELVVIHGVPAKSAAEQCGMSVDHLHVAKGRVTAKLREIVARVESEWTDDAMWTG